MSIPEHNDPVALFHEWLAEAAAHPGIADATAMTLATATAEGIPSARVVLLKAHDGRGFVFYTNLGSGKAAELRENPHAALCFYWAPVGKQVRIQGKVEEVTAAEADAYFATRPRQSQLGAWASRQSHPLKDRQELEQRLLQYTGQFADAPIPRPKFWSGFRVVPATIEFWQNQPYRLHDRLRYVRSGDGWSAARLYP